MLCPYPRHRTAFDQKPDTVQNRVPDDLYYAGVQRDRMAGFLDALKSRCEVVELDGGRDWRRGAEEEDENGRKTTWYSSGDEGFELAWRETLGGQSGQSIFCQVGISKH